MEAVVPVSGDKLLDAVEARAALRCGQHTLRKLVREKKLLPSAIYGRKWLFPQSAIERVMATPRLEAA